jgi:hypothetical protein
MSSSSTATTTTVKSGTQSWKLEGDYFEGCNCDLICPCTVTEDPDEGNCYVITAWHIQKGNYGNTNLDGLNAVAMFNAPGNMLKGPKWKAALYIDEKASSEQYDALTKIYSGQAGGFFAAVTNLIGEMLGIKSVPIEFNINGKRRSLRVKDSLELEIEGVNGADPNKDVCLVNPVFSAVPGSDLIVARSNKYHYKDYGFEWNNSGKNGFYCKFSYSS